MCASRVSGALLLAALWLSVCLTPLATAHAQESWFSDLIGSGEKAKRPARATKPSKIKFEETRSWDSGDYELSSQEEPTGGPGSAREKKTAPPLVGTHFAPNSSGKWQWKVTREAWTDQDEALFGEFLRDIGESSCSTSHECLTSPIANPRYHEKNPPGMQFFADCADLPFMLRGYFAWMNGLPYSFPTAVGLHPGSSEGNLAFQITGRYHIVAPGPDARFVLPEIGRVSTAHFRAPAAYLGKMLFDYYPVRISRESVKPGTVIFDPLGHIMTVYKVTESGQIHFIDAHPDNALTRGLYGSEIERAGPLSGAGFIRWRPQKLVGAKRGADGKLSGGKLVLAENKELPDWSDEQYYGAGVGRSETWQSGKFFIDGNEVDYYGYVRLSLAPKGYKFNPIEETRTRMRALCQEVNQRVNAVDAAVKAGMHRRPQPARLPQNLYVTQGDWEAYATSSRDAQLRTIFKELREDSERFVTLADSGHQLIDYQGTNLRQDLMETYMAEAKSCSITYTKSDGAQQTLGLEEITKRLFRLSFDPYHCPERRWGADDGAELKSCPDDATKRAWYEAEQRLRNQLVRTIGDRMDFTLDDLKRQAREGSDVGENQPPVVDVLTVLAVSQ